MQFSRYIPDWCFYQSFKRKNPFLLKSLVKPAISNSISLLMRVSTGSLGIRLFPPCFRHGSLSGACIYIKQVSLFFSFLVWRPPALPHRLQCSTIGRLGLNRRVRDGNGCFPDAHRHQKKLLSEVLSPFVGRTTFLTKFSFRLTAPLH